MMLIAMTKAACLSQRSFPGPPRAAQGIGMNSGRSFHRTLPLADNQSSMKRAGKHLVVERTALTSSTATQYAEEESS